MFSEPVRSDYATYSAFAMATLGYAIVVGRHVDANCRGGDHICRGSVGYDVGDRLQGVLEGFVSSGSSRIHGPGDCRPGVVSGSSDLAGSVAVGGDDGSVCVDRREASVEEGARCSFERGVGHGASAVVEDASVGVRGKHYESNRRKRMIRKAKRASCRSDVEGASGVASRACLSDDWRKSGFDSEAGVSQNVPTLAEFVSAKIDEEFIDSRAMEVELKVAERIAAQRAKKTLAERWAVENELAAAKAKRSLEVLMAQDVQAEIKKQSTYLKLQTEKNMVGMEKAHQFLKRTGNVPGFAQTVLSDEGLTDGSSASPASPGECTISPDSSASMKEFREVVKKNADLEEKLARVCKMTKVSLEDLDDYDKNTWSLKSENYEKLDRMYPGGYILDPVPDYVDYDPPTHGYLKF